MSKVLVLCIPSHGHVNPVLGLASELIKQGENITFFCSNEFKEAIEATGANFKCYKEDLNIFHKKPGNTTDPTSGKKMKPVFGFVHALLQPHKFIDDVLSQLTGSTFDYVVFSSAYPYANVMAQILKIPAISSFAVFATQKELFNKNAGTKQKGKSFFSFHFLKNIHPFKLFKWLMFTTAYGREFAKVRQRLKAKYGVEVSRDMLSLFFNKGDLNIAYTSKYFIPDIEKYDDSFLFIGPPVYNKQYQVDFPFEKLKGKKVIYISLGTVFSNYSTDINNLFFRSFANTDAIVVMAAYNVDTSQFDIPENFIIRNYVPQLEILQYTSVAITHAGMNSMGDLLYNNIPFVSIPLGADQFYLANRAEELGATIVLDINHLTPEIVREAAEKVLANPSFLENIKKISQSFMEAGGYRRAVEEIFRLKRKKNILN